MKALCACMVVASYPPHGGGSERQCALLARHLVRQGVRVVVLTRRLDDAPAREERDGVEIVRLGAPRMGRWLQAALFSTATMRQIFLRRRHVDLVHCHGFEPLALTGALTRRIFHKPLVIKVVTSGAFGDLARLSALPGWRAVAQHLAHADSVVVLNDEARHEMEGIGVGAEKIWLIPNGVEIPAWTREPNPDTALFCGRLAAQKNVPGLLRAWARTAAAKSRQLDIVGGGSDRVALEGLARDLGIGRSVCFRGRVDDVSPFYRRAACVVLFSHAEGLSNAVLEALAAAVPVVGSDIPGIREVVRHGETGLLVPPADEAALAQAIDRIFADPAAAAQMGRTGRSLIAARYDIESIAAQVHALYEQLMKMQSVTTEGARRA